MAVPIGILLGSVAGVYLLYAVVLREYAVRLLWPTLVAAWLLIVSALLLSLGEQLLPENLAFVVFVQRYPGLIFVLALGAAALVGWICRPYPHLFVEPIDKA